MKRTAGKRQVSVEIAAQHGFNGTFGDGLCVQACMKEYSYDKNTVHVISNSYS